MARTVNYAKKLRKIIANLEELAIALEGQGNRPVSKATNGKAAASRTRRSKKEAAQLRKLLKAERKAGVPVAELARSMGISTAYVYMLQ